MTTNSRWRSERGAVLIHTGVALIGLLAFSALSIDRGVLWVSRGQAQNAADAGALAAAISLAYGNPSDKARAREVAIGAGQANPVWGAPPGILAGDVTFPACPAGAPGLAGLCVRVNVLRNQAAGRTPLPTFFARLVGVNNQGVQATATAQVAVGTSARCVRPWAVPDKWLDRTDNDPPKDEIWTSDDNFDRYVTSGKKAGDLIVPPHKRDEYVPDVGGVPGSGFRVPDDIGLRVRLTPGSPQDTDVSGWFLPLALGGTGSATYEQNISSCNDQEFSAGAVIGTEAGIEDAPGNMNGATRNGVDALIAQDPDAVWSCDGSTQAPTNSNCLGTVINSAHGISPRIVPIPIFDIQDYLEQKYAGGTLKTSGHFNLKITRLVGFFVERRQTNDVVGRFTYYPADGIGNSSNAGPGNFLRKVILVR